MKAKHLFLSTAAVFAPSILVAAPAAAQVTLDAPNVRLPVDEHGVDLTSGEVIAPSSSVSIGGSGGLSHTRTRVGNGWRHNYLMSAEISSGSTTASVYIGGARRSFTLNGSIYESDHGTGETISANFSTGTHTYTGRDGTQIIFKESYVANGESYYGVTDALAETIIRPGGHRTTLHYLNSSYSLLGNTIYMVRLQSVTTNTSYQLKFDYATNALSSSSVEEWQDVSKVTAINNGVDHCDPMSNATCTFSQNWPSLTYTKTVDGTDMLETVTDVLGRSSRYRNDSADRLSGFKRPGESTDGVVFSYDANDRVSSIQYQGSYTRTYTWSLLGPHLTSNSNDSLGRFRATATDVNQELITYVNNGLNEVTLYEYDANGRLEVEQAPEGQRTEYTYDARGNTTEVRQKAIAGTGLADLVSTASFPANCTNQVTCNKPTATTGPNGASILYTYDTTHGGVTRIDSPPDDNGDRLVTQITYVTRTSKKKNASGSLVNQATSLTLPSNSRACRTQELCANSADEGNTDIVYDANISPNLLPVSVTNRAGNNTLATTTAYTYSHLGDVKTIDGPLAGAGDVTTYRYDDAGQVLGVIAPDPDGSGPLTHLATRATYNDDGQVTLTESGYVTGTSDTDWSGFTVVAANETIYDEFGMAEASSQLSPDGTTRYSITQYGYDYAGRLDCTAVRMNLTNAATALPADACVKMTPGTFGEDRITKRVYDVADRVTEVWAGVDTDLSQQSAEMAYNPNGTLAWVEDAENNRTTYTYDGHSRAKRTTFPSETTPGTSESSDYQEVEYDASGNVWKLRTRIGETFEFFYDPARRLTEKRVPSRSGLNATHTQNVYYEYNLFGALMEARFDAFNKVTMAYDGLGRLARETQTMDGTARATVYRYDLAGRLQGIRHPDSAYWQYEYDTANRLLRIKDDDSNTLITNIYDNAGRLTQRLRDNNAPDENFYFDNAERLERILTQHPVSSSQTYNREYAYNNAGQAVSEQLDRQQYVWDGHVQGSVDVPYGPDGLNQYDDVNGTNFLYDANGNLTSDGSTTFVYDTENRLVGASGGNNADLRYDPLGRLYEIKDAGGNITRLHYSGNDLIGEYNASGTMLHRYVHGLSGGDDPLIHYNGANASAVYSRHLYTDRLGSVVSSYDRGGVARGRNSYDEFGMPGPVNGIENTGRFRYTGQIYIPELGMYHYKARAYSPGLGRFMQTDPIGYGDGLNMYAYVGNNPVNLVDSAGTKPVDNCVIVGQSEVCGTGDDGTIGGGGKGSVIPEELLRPDLQAFCDVASDLSPRELVDALPEKGVIEQVVDGIVGYGKGLLEAGENAVGSLGLLGADKAKQAQNDAQKVATNVLAALDRVSSASEQQRVEGYQALVALGEKYPWQIGARQVTNISVGKATPSYVGLPLNAAAAYGNLLQNADLGANGVVISLAVGEICEAEE